MFYNYFYFNSYDVVFLKVNQTSVSDQSFLLIKQYSFFDTYQSQRDDLNNRL